MKNTYSNILSFITAIPNRLTDKIGMYRVVSLALGVLAIFSIIAGAVGWIGFTPTAQITSLVIAVSIALGLNVVIAKITSIHANHESALITALILFFLVVPDADLIDNWILALATALAILSKYFIVYRKQHIFNPVATGAVLVAFGVLIYNLFVTNDVSSDLFQWWVANPTLFWPLVILGSLVVFKIRRWPMVLACIGSGLVLFTVEGWFRFDASPLDSIELFLMSFPVLFLAFFMLTEPFTTPPTRNVQIVYGVIVGVLSSTILFAGWFPMTPELALIIGNTFAYTYRIRRKLFLKLQSKRNIATDTWEFTFSKPEGFSFTAGQYVEWMLPHEKVDSRGPRRYFTIASSPTESVVRLAMKIVPKDSDMRSSTYKNALMEMDEGEQIIVSQLAGDFVLPKDTSAKLGFIAGGIGVTPFSSHLSWMQDSGKEYNTRLYYCCNTMAELAFFDQFTKLGETMPVVTIPVIAREDVQPPNERGFVTKEMLARRTPDYKERVWYVSGPPGMVNAYKKLLKEAGVPRKQIKTDFFPGLA